MAKLILATEQHFPGRVTWRGPRAMQKLKEHFVKVELLEKAKQSPFKQFFAAPLMQFSSALMHQLLMRKIKSNSRNELQIHVGGKNMRFGIGEFALITGLNFGNDPSSDVPHSTRLVKKYLNDNATVRSQELEDAFLSCIDKDDAWKLGLCYFVDSVLYSNESHLRVDIYLFSLVEDETTFFEYPFGRYSFEKTLVGIDKDMVHFRSLYEKAVKAKKKIVEAKYTVYGYALSFQYRAYEAITQLGTRFASNLGVKFPRMLTWTSNSVPLAKKLVEELKKKKLTLKPILNPRSDEDAFFKTIIHSPHDIIRRGVETDDTAVRADMDAEEAQAVEAIAKRLGFLAIPCLMKQSLRNQTILSPQFPNPLVHMCLSHSQSGTNWLPMLVK